MSFTNSDVVPLTGGAYEIEQSLRTEDSYLSRTTGTHTNRNKMTISFWWKRGTTDDNLHLWRIVSSGNENMLRITGDQLLIGNYQSGYQFLVRTNRVFRDYGSWYHIFISIDTTQATSSDRVKMYINGVRETSLNTATYPSQNFNIYGTQSGLPETIGDDHYGNYTNSYFAEFHKIDGQALEPTDFGEFGDYGEWKPIEYTGTYGSDGYYLPFKQDYEVEGFSTTLYTGNAQDQYVGGVGFSPDTVWIKNRNSTQNHFLMNTVTPNEFIIVNASNSADTNSGYHLTHNTDGFTVQDSAIAFNTNNNTYVAWCWDMGGSNASNTNGSITSTVRANTTYGQSIVSYTGNGTAGATIGHGLSSAPELVIVRARNNGNFWVVGHHELSSTPYVSGDFLYLNTNYAKQNASNVWNGTAPTSSVITLGTSGNINVSARTYIAYCFHSVSGYSKFGSYTGTGSTLNISTGFNPAMVIIKNTSSIANWTIVDNVRGDGKTLYPNDNFVEDTSYPLDFKSTSFDVLGNSPSTNTSGDTYIYMAFADKREFAYWLDQSGNNNDWTSNNLTESDISVDSPTNNFATFNPLTTNNATLSEGNLKWNTSGGWLDGYSTIALPSSGKWYAEFKSIIGSEQCLFGLRSSVNGESTYMGWYSGGGTINASSISGFSSGDRIGVAVDVDNGTVKVYKNGTLASTSTGKTVNDLSFYVHGWNVSWYANFGQDSSFAGNETAQGNQDGNNIGDFYYTPPSGYLALCTANLSDPAVIPSENFNTIIWSGDSTSPRSFTGIGFQPDFTWFKPRSNANYHQLYDAVRGATKVLFSNATNSEVSPSTNGYLSSFDSDGFTLTAGTDGDNDTNDGSHTYVAWNWKANGSGSSNTNGSITSTVSANQDAGFSIITYTGTGSSGTLGHGLSQAPEIWITKKRSTTSEWFVLGDVIGIEYVIQLNTTSAKWNPTGNFTQDTSPTNSVLYLGNTSDINGSSTTYVSYAFHSVDGFSKVGTYTGNGSTDGTFVYTGFRPAYVMYRNTELSENWVIHDTKRDVDNLVHHRLDADRSNAEDSTVSSTHPNIDIVSNGFKHRAGGDISNASGRNYIYIAFAENPFKYTNAR